MAPRGEREKDSTRSVNAARSAVRGPDGDALDPTAFIDNVAMQKLRAQELERVDTERLARCAPLCASTSRHSDFGFVASRSLHATAQHDERWPTSSA